jgi:hypothetical protein
MIGTSGAKTIQIGNVTTLLTMHLALVLRWEIPSVRFTPKHPGWKDVIGKAKKQPGSNLKHYD